VKVLLDHPVPPVGFGDGVVNRELVERRDDVVPKKEPYILPLV
jgi:hypothetical protein